MIKTLIKKSCDVGKKLFFLLKICIKGILLLKSEYCYSYKLKRFVLQNSQKITNVKFFDIFI